MSDDLESAFQRMIEKVEFRPPSVSPLRYRLRAGRGACEKLRAEGLDVELDESLPNGLLIREVIDDPSSETVVL